MRVLVFSSSPSVLTEEIALLDVAWQQHAAGHQVVYLRCTGALRNCPANPEHTQDICRRCIHQSDHTTRRLLPPGSKVVEIPPTRDDGARTPDFRTLSQVASFTVDGAVLGHFLVSALLDETRDIHEDLSEEESRRAGLLAVNAEHLYRSALDILSTQDINHVAVRVPRRDSDGPVIAAAQRLGLTTSVLYPARTADDLRVAHVGGTTTYEPEHFRARLDALAAQAEVGGPIHEAGARFFAALATSEVPDGVKPIFVFPTSERWTPARPPTGRPVLAIFPSSDWEALQFHYTRALAGAGTTGISSVRTQYDILEEMLTTGRIQDLADVIVRWHPHLRAAGPNEHAALLRLANMTQDTAEHLLPESSVSSRDVIEKSDVVMTFGSSLTADALWMGRRTVIFGETGMEALASVTMVRSVDELARLMETDAAAVASARSRHDAALLAYVLNGLDLPRPRHLELGPGGWALRVDGTPVKATQATARRRWTLRALLRGLRSWEGPSRTGDRAGRPASTIPMEEQPR